MDLTGIGSIFDFGNSLINKIFPDPEDKAKAESLLLKAKSEGKLDELDAELQVMMAEAKSKDKWTSRARPSFLYVIYIMILTAIPMGIVYAVNPGFAKNITEGVSAWLKAVPSELWTLFGVGYLGYTTAREYGKKKIIDGISSMSKK